MYLEESDVCYHHVGRKIEKKRHELTFGIPGLGMFNPFVTSGTYVSLAMKGLNLQKHL
jgi:hypothetical protein